MKHIQTLGLFFILHSNYVLGCSWAGATPENIQELYDGSVTVFHGLVIETEDKKFPLSAKLKIIESFKGSPENEVYSLHSDGPCMHIFKLGDEFIYFTRKDGSFVGAPGVEIIQDWLVNSLRQLKSNNEDNL
jgi:hypothetical protein